MKKQQQKSALVFLVFLGFISLLSDFTHEGARSIYGSYLGLIGVSAFLISLISGLGEFLGQALRIGTGIIADRTRKYWFMMILGYAINLLAIPLIALTNESIWQVALVLILLERVGKAIRAPAKSALVSFTTPQLGAGKAFAIQEALDQLGAFLGPLFVFAILSVRDQPTITDYQLSFALLGIFAIMTLVLLVIAKRKYPHPDEFETKTLVSGFRSSKTFILYLFAISFIAFGFIDFPVIAFHLDQSGTIPAVMIPLLYAFAMGIDAISALFFGHLFDKIGIKSLIIAIGLSLAFAPLIFLTETRFSIIAGVLFWGVGMGAHESILKSVVALIVSKEKRATAYGIFNSVFGLAWFLGSVTIGLLYEWSLIALVAVSLSAEGIGCLLLLSFIHYKKDRLNSF
ncbi:MAG: MFS transporter [Candidatus Izemoplasmatales bacterium]|jgi:MFS family permease|nr:MFS transporter [Candidatus Izemoplasmatales bacterium]MDD5602070.1 MFS transporter [Candidatus Izemoplasmatales bacterium]MDY0373354.1 MFS transporter [Candidatus Izemoplasmatales bacterium]NLF49471.1 MFS transporter [Acholeplasmataceae bacterium]